MSGYIPEIEISPLSGHVFCDGISVEIRIQRFTGIENDWVLEVISDNGGATAWTRQFKTDQEALSEFNHEIECSGILADVPPPNRTIHGWNFPIMIPRPGDGEFHEGIEVF